MAAVRVVVDHVAPKWKTRVRFSVLDQNAGIADSESPDAATEFPCCLMPCDVIFCCCCCCCCLLIFSAHAGASMRERVRSWTQLDRTVVAVAGLVAVPVCICWLLTVVVVVVLVAVLFVAVVVVGVLLLFVGYAYVL